VASILPLYEATQFVPGRVFGGTFLGGGVLASRTARALQVGLELATRGGDQKFYVGWMRRLIGEIAIEKNPKQAAEPFAAPYFEECISIFRGIKAENELAVAYAGYGRLHKQQGRTAEAREYFTRALELFERLGTPDRARQGALRIG
jgi:tetratricopeptide (TPR) repeat protein